MNKRLHTQQGMSLVGLMVASTIGLFITAAALQMYSNSQQTYKTRQAQSVAAENARFAISDLSRMIVMAGRGMDAASNRDKKEIDATFPRKDDDAYKIEDGTGPNNSDVIYFRVAKGRDCFGNNIVAVGVEKGKVTLISYSVVKNATTGINELVCSIDEGDSQALVSGIEMLKFLYGLDTTGDKYANMYLSAAQIDSIRDGGDADDQKINKKIWEEIVSIRMGVVASSAEFEVPGGHRATGTAKKMTVLHGEYMPADNKHIYRINTATVALRNKIVY